MLSTLPRVAAIAAAGAASLVVAVTLSGCAAALLFVPHSTHAAATSTSPSAGDCWTSTASIAASAANWTASAAVSCSTSHQLYTYAVASVTSSASTWQTASGTLDDTIATAGNTACRAQLDGFLGNIPTGLIEPFFFVPSVSQWRAGARWIRCDIGLFLLGSPVAAPALDKLPPQIDTLVQQVTSHPDAYGECVTTSDSSGQTGPYDDPKAVLADCTGDYQWQYILDYDFPGESGSAYPSASDRSTVEQTECGDGADAAGRQWLTYVPTENQWADGRRDASCWYYRNETPQT